jgi:hypothetical protein
MSISVQYVDMCKKAEEIQRKASLDPGNVWYQQRVVSSILG